MLRKHLIRGMSFRTIVTGLAMISPLTSPAIESTDEGPSQQLVIAAALEGQLSVVEDALVKGYDANAKDPTGRTPILYAAYNGHTKVVARLIEAGADINAQDPTGSTALMFASSGPFTETVTLLLDKGAKINLVDNNEHFTALMWAAAEGQVEVAKILLARGADTTLTDIDGDTAESFAAKAGHAGIVKLLQSTEPAAEDQGK